MINRVAGEVSFLDGLHIVPHHTIQIPHRSRVFLKNWRQHFLGVHPSEHGQFEVEALSRDVGRIQMVMLAHRHPFYESKTPADAERRTFHEGIISLDLAGQREFSWGEVLCRLHVPSNKDWLVIAYNRDANIPLKEKRELLQLLAHEKPPKALNE